MSLDPTQKTIAAVATPPGEGGIAVIRISGKAAVDIADKVFSGPVYQYPSHTVHFGKILDGDEVIDDVLLVVMRAPRSYTGEDVVEINCHGGSLITRRVLELILNAGATAAGPGEFTYQAYMNGKLDLAQAEAVQTLIGAKNDLALESSRNQLAGRLSAYVQSLQQELFDTAAILEAWVDFPEEGIEFASQEEVIALLENTLSKMDHLEKTFHEGRKIHEGLNLCLIGSPNAGKSSLMNALLGHERAIVTPIAGTTRDLLDAELKLGGLHFRLIDTAGIRETEEIIEQEGIKRSKAAIVEADLILLLIDISRPLSKEDQELIELAPKEKTLIIGNKSDLLIQSSFIPKICISAKTKAGLEILQQAIEAEVWKGKMPEKGEIILTNVRHKEAIHQAALDLRALIEGLKTGISPEFLAADMRSCLRYLSSIIGVDIAEEILSSIFAKFCVGK